MKKIYSLFILFFIVNTAFSQVVIEWQNTIGGSANDALYSIHQTYNGSYILIGSSDSNISGDKTEDSKGGLDYWVIKTNALGNIEWQKTIGGSGDDQYPCIHPTVNGGYIIGGLSSSNISGDKTENSKGGFDFWILKLDINGNIQWQKTIGGSGVDRLNSIRQTTDDGYILGGYSDSNISGDKSENSRGGMDYWIVKTDSTGNIQWQRTYGGSEHDWLSSMQQTSDGGYILGGFSYSGISGDKTEQSQGGWDYWIIKINAAGYIQWQKTIGGSSADYLTSIKQTTDGGFILGGRSFSSISGDKTEDSKGGYDYWIVKTDSFGNIQWQKTIGGNNGDYLTSIQQTNDGNFILGGYSASDISGDKTENCKGGFDYWIIKISDLTAIEPTKKDFNLSLYPNPTTAELNITLKLDKSSDVKIELYNSLGQLVITITDKKLISGENKINFSTESYPAGIYHLIFSVDGELIARKVVKM
jgi:hypothetical protein